MIFDRIHRTDQNPRLHNETSFAFLQRSGWPESENVRNFIETWVDRCPKSERNSIIRRINSGDETGFRSACFELILFSMMFQLEFQIEFHPFLLNGNSNQPDFKIRVPSGVDFYLEAVCPSNKSNLDRANDNREAEVLAAIDRISISGFSLSIEFTEYGSASPPTRILRQNLVNWIATLDAAVISANSGFDDLPKHVWRYEGWEIEFTAIPLRREAEQRPRRPIGVLFEGAQWGNRWEVIRDAILDKGRRYGDLDAPLLLAVNSDAFQIDRDDEMQALFGGDQVRIDPRFPDQEPQFTRARNGAWFGPNGPRSNRVAGVWIFNDVTPWSIAGRRGTLYFNPYREFSLPSELERFSYAIANGREIEWHDGLTIREALDLPESWPRT